MSAIRVILAACVVTTCVWADGVNGKWSADVPGRHGGIRPVVMDLKEDDGILTGRVRAGRGEDAISAGTIDGDEISFSVVTELDGYQIRQHYKGTLEDDVIHFSLTVDGERSPVRNFEAKRVNDQPPLDAPSYSSTQKSHMSFEREVELARQMAQEAGALALDYQRRGVTAEAKADESPVTEADKACEKLIVDSILSVFPEDGVLGEEGANRDSRNGRRWIIDPIDGTRDFVRGIPLWAVLIALEQDGRIVAGAAHSPRQGLLLSASLGGGAWSNGLPLRVSDKSDPTQAVLSFNGFNKVGIGHFSDRLLPWVHRFWAVRSLGGAVDAMLLAQGQADVWIEPNAQPWDLAPLKLLIEEAGGVMRSFTGENTIYGGNAYACVPGLEPYVQQLLG